MEAQPGYGEQVRSVGREPDDFAMEVSVRTPSELDERIIGAWAELEQRSVEPNAYLSPWFVLPALKHLEPRVPVVVILIERKGVVSRDLVGLGVYETVRRSGRIPMAHLRAFRSRHSYLTGLLLDRDCASEASRAYFRFLRRDSSWHGVEVTVHPTDGQFGAIMTEAARKEDVAWYEYGRSRRAILMPAKCGEDYLRESVSSRELKDIRRRKRRLEELGTVTWRALAGQEVDARCIDRFLDLEHRGWKGEHGSSLRSNAGDEAFFREMATHFADHGRAIFTELAVNEVVIASTSNFVSGSGGFAFKLGWDPQFTRMAPGRLNEIELVRNGGSVFRDLDYVDSGAAEGSFIEDLWPDKRTLVSGVYASTAAARAVLGGMNHLRRLKRRLPFGS
ncbi:MAG: hypothetical protein AMJ84_00810 [Acidithiobacillales bacterium SM23_46]|jgi:CelD/BcsL family acetyltransferase involved in cellulose biosynthesis|nr:MAG: hypothetical protein AMJ84_00810 [Acidithiobacillales bacterium SM23_46]